MNAEQLSLFPETQRELADALKRIKQNCIPHRHFREVVDSVVTMVRGCEDGEILVAALPAESSPDELINAIRKDLRESGGGSPESGSAFMAGIVRVTVPAVHSAGALRKEFFDRYRAALCSARISHRTTPRWTDHGDCFAGMRTEFGSLIDFVRFKSPSLVVVQDVHRFAFPGASRAETRVAWNLILDIARASGVPHLLFGSIHEIGCALEDGSLQEAVRPVFLRPYEFDPKDKQSVFRGILNDYGKALPWANGNCLADTPGKASKATIVHRAVHGDPERLRRWLIRALGYAISKADQKLKWEHLEATIPNWRQRELAHNEATLVRSFCSPCGAGQSDDPSHAKGVEKKSGGRKLKPGNRKDDRDDVAA